MCKDDCCLSCVYRIYCLHNWPGSLPALRPTLISHGRADAIGMLLPRHLDDDNILITTTTGKAQVQQNHSSRVNVLYFWPALQQSAAMGTASSPPVQ